MTRDSGRPAAITGIGCVTNFGCGFPCAWNGQLGSMAVTRARSVDNASGHTTLTTQAPPAGELEAWFSKLGYPRPSRATLMALLAAQEAWLMSGLSSLPASSRIGVMINRCFGEIDIQTRYYRTLRERGPVAASGLDFVQSLANTVLGRVAMELKARGPSVLVVGPSVFGLALDALRNNEADVIVAGGVDHLADYVCDLCDAAGLTPASRGRREVPSPYVDHANGLVPGDGAAFLVLERADYARARGANPIALLKGGATVMDSFQGGRGLHRTPADVVASVERALEDAGVGAGDIDFVSGAATGLDHYDDAELDAICSTFPGDVAVYSTKAVHGETWGAAGALSLASAAKVIETGLLPAFGRGRNPGAAHTAEEQYTGKPLRAGVSLSFDIPGSHSTFVVSSC